MHKLDLHMHSICSDGLRTPTELIKEAARANTKLISLTDHDSISGVREAWSAGEEADVWVIPGIELEGMYTENAEVHMLGYFLDIGHPPLLEHLDMMFAGKKERNARIFARLEELGVDIHGEIPFSDSKSISRTHIGIALIRRGYASSMKDAFDKYLGSNGRAHCTHERRPIEYIIKLIHDSGGICCAAHPFQIKADTQRALESLADMGLDAVEVYYPSHTRGDIILLKSVAKRLSLEISSGSDYHAEYRPGVGPGCAFAEDERLQYWYKSYRERYCTH